MKPISLAAALLISAAPALAQTQGEIWWKHVEILATDDMQGRLTGSPGHARAVAYVADRFRAFGLQPAGVDGYIQPVALEQQRVVAAGSRAALVADGASTPLTVGRDIIIGAGGGPRPASIEAPLVFAGYGLHLPEAGHDDFAGLDIRGKVVVVISGGPQTISGALKSHARRERAAYVASQGGLGIIDLTTPKAIEIPWARQMLLSSQPGMYLADPALRDSARPLFDARVDPAQAEKLFTRSGHSFAEMAALADASAAVPGFALNQSIRAAISAERAPVHSANVVGRLPGSDPKLAAENVIVSAHVDGLGVGEPINGDRIYNGAIDNASGVASLLEIARRFQADKARPKRSILFVVVTAEEKGLLGSRYFAARPTVPKASLVADVNYDMALPLWPLTSVLMHGAGESSLGTLAASVGQDHGLPLVTDPFPDRNVFVRSDQYSFIRAGIPSLFVKFGFRAGTPDAETERAWRANRYHSPSDDPAQPVMKEEAVKLDRYVGDLVLRIADAPTRPTWNTDSFFKRFAD
ncbi:M28 family metallopeptidase [Sphingomonas quercus]|uniref:M20/M25/M40 family metallo-hydrolase n=1 Tax=Sphingomonas quercus TaxID=2842451 RepID=A0ABS6BGV3_9SPHN|nr:M28 family metallopeptidase [Sphingomonas quercus]MBU3077419.1 M20/M25/M40 family metallo-hydrolase [Sphingomonas quercus]